MTDRSEKKPAKRFRWTHGAALAAISVIAIWYAVSWLRYPSDRTPEGAYLRVMSAVNRGRAQDFFAYIETRAQHASYTIRDYRRKASKLILESYPEPERSRLSDSYREVAQAPDGSDVFALYAKQKGWLAQLRRDMSGIEHVEVQDERATVQTVQGTRYPFRRRDNGIWGLTLFTATLSAEAERAARDYALIEQAARDYERVKKLEQKQKASERSNLAP